MNNLEVILPAVIKNNAEMFFAFPDLLTEGKFSEIHKNIDSVLKFPINFRDALYFENFKSFLNGIECDEVVLHKFSSLIAEDDSNRKTNAKRIIKIISDIDTIEKSQYIAYLTRALCGEFIKTDEYFRLARSLVYLTVEDLEILKVEVHKDRVYKDELFIDDFRMCGLVFEVKDGFALSKRAFDLRNYALCYEEKQVEYQERHKRTFVSGLSYVSIEEVKK